MREGHVHILLLRVRLLLAAVFALFACLGLAREAGLSSPLPGGENSLKAEVPLGLPADTWDYYIPKSNPLTKAKVELGRKLFFDPRLSADEKVSCASCHDPKLAFTDGKTVAEGIGGQRGARNSPTILNAIYNPAQFWDGRVDTLEEQAILPLINPLEMGNPSPETVIARLRQVPEYRESFQAIFGTPVTIKGLAQAIAAYERTLVSGDSPFDRFIAGDQTAISDAARRGFALFRGKARCSRCHVFNEISPFFTDFAYHNTGVAANHPAFERLARQAFDLTQSPQAEREIAALGKEQGGEELGRVLVTYQPFDIGSFKTPSLRNVALTAPYFHDGSAKTLAEVVRFYNEGGKPNLNREWDLHPLGLTSGEQRDLVAFMETLTGKMPETERASLSRR
jgi:cytochrome c peroxidase